MHVGKKVFNTAHAQYLKTMDRACLRELCGRLDDGGLPRKKNSNGILSGSIRHISYLHRLSLPFHHHVSIVTNIGLLQYDLDL